MTARVYQSYIDNFRRAARVEGTLVVLLSCLALAGWQFDVEAFKSLVPGLTPMNPGGSAVGFLLAGLGLWANSVPNSGGKSGFHRWAAPVRYMCAAWILVISVFGIGHYLLGWSWGPDLLLFPDKLARQAAISGFANRIAPNTAVAFLFTGLALLAPDFRCRRFLPAQGLALAVILLSLLAVIGYAYNALRLTAVMALIPMALATALCFLLVGTGLLFSKPEQGLMAVFSGTGAGGVLARRLLPVAVLFPAAAGCLVGFLVREGLVGQLTAMSLFSLACILLFAGLIWRTASSLEMIGRTLQESEERYALSARGTNDGLWDWNIATGELFWSARFKDMLGITDPAYQPRFERFMEHVEPEDRPRISSAVQDTLATGAPYDAEFRMRTETGKTIWARARGAGVRDEAGQMTRMAGSITDITAAKEAEEALKVARAAADKANQAKSDFLANMSHELRTPLNSIIGLNRMLFEDSAVAEEHRDMIGIAYRSADRLLDIVNDILDLSKVEAGELELEKIVFSLEEVLDDLGETMMPLCSQKGLTFTCGPDTGGLPYIVGDPLRLSRIMVNLVGNAVKYTETGSITVRLACLPLKSAGEDRVAVEFSVTDTGIGIPPEKQGHIFEKFAQADTTITRRFGGTGLGLAITRELVQKMGGEIGVDSEAGKGSRFWFRIPFITSKERPVLDKKAFRRGHPDQLPDGMRKPAAGVSVLLAEDFAFNQIFMGKLLARLGIGQFDIVDTGKDVLERIAKKTYDIVLMDCHMPVMGGYEATRILRSREKESAGTPVPIVAMTADAMRGTREKCLQAGMDDYISKPINPDELKHILSRWITFDGAGTDGVAPAEEGKSAAPAPAAPAAASIDLALLRKVARTEDGMRRFAGMFLKQGEDILALLAENCRDGENKAWSEAAHKLKGSAGMIGAAKLVALCDTAQEMETAAGAARETALAEIRAAFEHVRASLGEAFPGVK